MDTGSARGDPETRRVTRGQLGKTFSRGANIRDSDDDDESLQEEGSSQGYGDEEREDEVENQEDEEVSEFRVKVEDTARKNTSRPRNDIKTDVNAPQNPNARVTRSTARKYSG